MKAFVTGGCGFIGSHLVEALVAAGHRVIVFDNLSTGRLGNIEELVSQGKIDFVRGDVQDSDSVISAMQGSTHVFHLAALADIVPSIVDPLKYFSSNVNGTAIVAEAARQLEVEKIVYAASSSCYGIPEQYPTPEWAPIQPQYPYALTKWLGEQVVRHWGTVYDLPFVSLRLFNVYGPRARTTGTYGAVFGVFLAQKLAAQPMTIVGDGTQRRDFTFVTDVARAFLVAAQSECRDAVFNVGTGDARSINELVALLGGDSVHIPKRPGEPDETLADISNIRKSLEWEPSVDFEAGVRVMLSQIQNWDGAPVWTPQQIEVATRDWFQFLGDER